ncbi:MAG TPA: ATP-binding protein, partial [Anaeromyxobacteraceae bacterium]|nr:ATP-binding protein [Anaeromyxobacteraceae bacterium]
SLLRGAALAMPVGSPLQHHIRVVARVHGTLSFVVEVADDGPPIHGADGTLQREPFSGQERVVRGGGAGLAAVMGMVRAVGGDVVAESAPGRGNVVRVTLPAALAGAEDAPRAATPRTRRGATSTPSA